MLLQNSLYYLVRSNEAEYTIRFEASHPIFSGHFPGHPVVPGACLVQIAEELLAAQLGQKVRFVSVRNLKFRQPVTPDMEVTFTLQCQMSNIKCQISDSASFSATYMCIDSDL